MGPELPPRLRYLQPLLVPIGPDIPAMNLFAERTRGLPFERAEAELEQDAIALHQWLSQPGRNHVGLMLARALLTTVTPAEILRLLRRAAQPPSPDVLLPQIKLPPDAKVTQRPGPDNNLIFSYAGLSVLVEAITPDEVADRLAFATEAQSPDDPIAETVRFAHVTGTKIKARRTNSETSNPFKIVMYVLTVPSGHVYAATISDKKHPDHLCWDESPAEALFPTLKVIRKRPKSHR